MDNLTPIEQKSDQNDLARKIRNRIIQVVVQFAIIAVILFLSSGRLDWVWAWVYLAVGVLILMINAKVLPPELIAERGEIKEDAEPWDRWISLPIGIFTLGTFVIAGLDQRFGWTPPLAPVVQIACLILYALAQGLFTWAMASNKFFSAVVRIQMEREQTVATGGPYRYVRHPGYLGYILSWVTTALALGSLWALISTVLMTITMAIRTALEDRTLQEKLPGYKEYSQKVHYRLLPGIW
jgi:protein-S-isoprenylcysteine O-methyltransferase Ste14